MQGLLLELPRQAAELHLQPGEKVQVQLAREVAVPVATPNARLMAALDDIAEIQKDMSPTDGSDTPSLIREARAGAMYGYEPSE